MRKLLLFFAMLCVSIGAWAYSSGGDGITLLDTGSDTQTITLTSAGALSTWFNSITDEQKGYFTGNPNRKKLVITGPMNADDFSAISGDTWSKFVEVDLSGVTVTAASDIEGINLINATKIKLPGDCADYAEASSSKWPAAEMIVGYKESGTLGIYTKEAGNVAEALRYYGTPFSISEYADIIGSGVKPANLKLAGEFAWNDFYTKKNNDDPLWGKVDSKDNKHYCCGLAGFDTNVKKTLTGFVDLSQVVFKEETYKGAESWDTSEPITKTVADCWDIVKNLFPSYGDDNSMSTGATELLLPTNPAYTTIPADLMNGGNGNGAKYSIKTLTIPSNYTTIEYGAFANCTGLTTLYIPENVAEISKGASTDEDNANSQQGSFQGCTSLEDVEFQARSSEIIFGAHTFDGCTGMKHINLPPMATSVAKYMFRNCSSLDAIRISDTVTSIEDGAFETCTSLKTIAIPASVRTMGHKVFAGALITDIYLMATTVDELPTIYSAGYNVANSDATFNVNSLYFNNSDPGSTYFTDTHDITEMFTSEVEQAYRDNLTGGNTLTFLHYDSRLRDLIDYNPWYNKSTSELEDAQCTVGSNDLTDFSTGKYGPTADEQVAKLIAGQYLSSTYGNGPDKEGRYWPQADHGDFARCLAAGDPTIALNTNEGSGDIYVDSWDTTGDEPSILGWRQFCLKTYFNAENPEDHYAGLYDDTWYTMCFPFDVTNNQLAGAFNPGYNICEFTGAAITKDARGNEAVAFMFTQIPLATYTYDGTEYTRKADANGKTLKDEDGNNIYVVKGTGTEITKSGDQTLWTALEGVDGVMAVAGHPYMIHPDKVEDVAGNATECVIQKVSYIDHYNVLEDSDPDKAAAYQKIKQLYLDEAVTLPLSTMTVSDDGTAEISSDKKVTLTSAGKGSYTFIGRFLPKKEAANSESVGYLEAYDKLSPKGLLPFRSYFLGVEGSNKYPKYYRQTSQNENRTTGYWSQFSAIIIPDDDAKSWELVSAAGAAKSIGVDFCEVEMVDATAIEKIADEAKAKGQDVKYMNVIVSIDGKVVRRDTTSIEGLPTGIYIINGKKYMVK